MKIKQVVWQRFCFCRGVLKIRNRRTLFKAAVWYDMQRWDKTPYAGVPVNRTGKPVAYNDDIRQAASHYGVHETLIKAIIQVESGFNPNVVSASNAVGLIQLKPSTAGRDAYRLKGLSGQPSLRELKNPAVNIDLGTAYINIIQSQQLAGINNPQTLRYATIVAYVNGAGAMLRTFALDKRVAVSRINQMSPDEFYQHIQKITQPRRHRAIFLR